MTTLGIVCFAILGLIFFYQAFLAVICAHPTLRRKLIETPETRGYIFPDPTPESRSYKAYRGYKTSARYDHQPTGV